MAVYILDMLRRIAAVPGAAVHYCVGSVLLIAYLVRASEPVVVRGVAE